MTETSPAPAELLDLPLPANESGASTVRGFLAALLGVAWASGDNIRPWGNSAWQYDLYEPLLDAGCAGGLTEAEAERLRQQYGIPEAKREELDRLVLDLIASLGAAPASAEAPGPGADSSWLTAAKRLQERLADAHKLIAAMLAALPMSNGDVVHFVGQARELGVTGPDGSPVGEGNLTAVDDALEDDYGMPGADL